MVEYGIGNENLRKMMSKDDSAVTANKAEDVLMAKIYDNLKNKLGKILKNHGPYAPYDMSDVEYRISLPKADKIMNAQTGEAVEGYKLTDMNLEYETIESEELAKKVKDEYEVGRELGYEYTTLLKTLEWSKSSTREVIDINIPRKSMRDYAHRKHQQTVRNSTTQRFKKLRSPLKGTQTPSTAKDWYDQKFTTKPKDFPEL